MTDETQTDEVAEEQPKDPEAMGFIGGISKANALRALQAADDVHMAQWRVRAVRDGFQAPNAIVDRYQELLEEETQAEVNERNQAEDATEPQGDDAKPAEVSTEIPGAGVPTAPVDGETPEVAGKIAPESDDLPADNDDWTHARLNDFAESNGLDVAKTLSKSDKVAAILAALNEKE